MTKLKYLLYLGESYNPTYEDHQNLLQKVADHEGQLIKKAKHIERVTTKMFCKKADIPTEVMIIRHIFVSIIKRKFLQELTYSSFNHFYSQRELNRY
jgi:hypothetical protein